MQLTSKKLKQLIRETLLKESTDADLEFLRDIKYSEKLASLQNHPMSASNTADMTRILRLYYKAKQDKDVVMIQYIEDMRIKFLEYTEEDIELVNDFLDNFDAWLNPSDWMEPLQITDLAEYIEDIAEFKTGGMPWHLAVDEAERLWWLVHQLYGKQDLFSLEEL